MKLISKLAFGSIAVATLTGFVLYADAPGAQPDEATADGAVAHNQAEAAALLAPFSAPLTHCPGRCEVLALMWRTR